MDKTYFRSRAQPHAYFEGKSRFSISDDHITDWSLRELGNGNQVIEINGHELMSNFEPCSPFEAIGSLSK